MQTERAGENASPFDPLWDTSEGEVDAEFTPDGARDEGGSGSNESGGMAEC